MKTEQKTKVINLEELRDSQIVDSEGQQATLEDISDIYFSARIQEARLLGETTGDKSKLLKLNRETFNLITSIVDHGTYIHELINRIDDPLSWAEFDKELLQVVEENIKRKENGEELLQAPMTPKEKHREEDFQQWKKERDAEQAAALPDIVDDTYTQRIDQAIELIELNGDDTELRKLKEEIGKLSDNLACHFGYIEALLGDVS